jgi:hypothetical protein
MCAECLQCLTLRITGVLLHASLERKQERGTKKRAITHPLERLVAAALPIESLISSKLVFSWIHTVYVLLKFFVVPGTSHFPILFIDRG